MQVLILYHSRTRNTQNLAREIADGVGSVQGVEPVMKSVSEVRKEDFLKSDAIIAGSPVYFGGMSAELKKVFDDFVGIRRKMENKIGAAFATSGHPAGGKETTLISIIQAFLIYGMIVVGDPMSASGHYGAAFSGKMDDDAKDIARKLGIRVAELALATRGLRASGTGT